MMSLTGANSIYAHYSKIKQLLVSSSLESFLPELPMKASVAIGHPIQTTCL